MENDLLINNKDLKVFSKSKNFWCWEMDNNNRYIFVSPSVKDIIGYEPEDMINKTPFDFIHENEAAVFSEVFNVHKKFRNPFWNIKLFFQSKDGKSLLFASSAVPVIDDNDNLRGYRGINYNIDGMDIYTNNFRSKK